MKLGVPFDLAHDMDWSEAQAYLIIAGEFEGGRFNWKQWAWDKPRD